MDLALRVLADLKRHALVSPGDRLLVAVSGGCDSLTLLYVLHELASRLSVTLLVAHLDHGLRGAEAVADAEAVAEHAARLGWPCVTERVRLAERAAAERLSLETAGRVARYEFFHRAARDWNCSSVATGHTADDAVETILMHLLRGAGLDGLRGIPWSRPLARSRRSAGEPPIVHLIRPLLAVTREETVRYCAERGLEPSEDPANQDLAFMRNRVRHRLLPALEATTTPGLRRRLLGLAAEAAEEVALLEGLAENLLESALLSAEPQELTLQRASLTNAPSALARRALRQAMRRLDPHVELDRATTKLLIRIAQGDLATGVTLPGGRLQVALRGEVLRLTAVEPSGGEAAPPDSGPVPLPMNGGATLAEWRISATLVHPPAEFHGEPLRRVHLDAEAIRGPLALRFPRAGDRVRPLGSMGRRKLQDVFVDARLPRAERSRVPLVVDDENILWVVGFCMSEEARLVAATRQAVCLEARRTDLEVGEPE